MNIYVVRHGQTDLNYQGRFQGQLDIQLNEAGKKQVEASKDILKKINFDAIYVSPLKRAIETAKIITDKELIVDNRLTERSFGKLEGKLSVPDYEEKAEYYCIESLKDVKQRVFGFLDEIKEKQKNKDNILLVTHEAVAQNINAYFNKINDIKEFRLKNGGYVMYKITDKEKLMKQLEDSELERGKINISIGKLKKTNKTKEHLHIVYLMVWTKVCGGSKIILEYANRLAQNGHKITLISYDDNPTWFKLEKNIKFIQLSENEKMEENIPECDIIIPTSWKNIYQAVSANKAPVTFFEQGGSHLFETENLSTHKFEIVKNRIGLVDLIHTVSLFSKQKIKEIYGKEAEVINNAVDSNIFYPRKNAPKSDDTISITIIGSEAFKFKNIDETLEAIRNIKEKYNNIQLNWISQDEPKRNPEKAIVNPKQIEIGNILRNTDIYICNSEYESFCLPALEAMTCGAAVITTDNGGIRDFVQDNYNALIVKKHNIKDLEEKIEQLIIDKELREKLMQNSLETAKQFSWENSVNKMEQYYKEVASYVMMNLGTE